MRFEELVEEMVQLRLRMEAHVKAGEAIADDDAAAKAAHLEEGQRLTDEAAALTARMFTTLGDA